jgi:hypothetical protein
MDNQTQIKHITDFTDKMKAVIGSKRVDYSQDSDTLSNFKQAASVCGISPEKVVLVFISIKVSRLGVLLNSNNAPNHESISDTILDLANYSALLEMVRSEKSTVDTPIYQQATEDAYCDYCSFARECDRKTCVAFPSTSK